jgi:cullin-associated NEDD8-dissociated protein 1
MQLFSMGLYRLHENGTRMIDKNGAPILAYDIEDVASLAAGWTGFERQQTRANYEDSILMTRTNPDGSASLMNVIDPMKVTGRYRDANPKRTPTRGYIGDGFPLCVDLPKQAFLKRDAKYRYLGRDPNPVKHTEPRDYGEHVLGINRTTIRTGSELFQKLCAAGSGPCRFKSEVVLSENLQCDGLECDLDTVRVVKLSNAGVREDGERYNVYYEYLRQPCVVQSYFADPTVVTGALALQDSREYYHDPGFGFSRYFGKYYRPMCVDPRTYAAGSVCCPITADGTRVRVREAIREDGTAWTSSGSVWSTVNTYVDSKEVAKCQFKYTNQRVSYATANDTCSALGQRMCNFKVLESDPGCERKLAYFWRPSRCSLGAQVTTHGHISVVDNIPGLSAKISSAHPLDSALNFRVVWADGKYPTPETSCGNGACTVRDETCLCSTRLSNEVVFNALPSTQTEVLSSLTVGAPNPAAFEADTYVVGGQNAEVTVYFLKSQPGFTTDAIFKVANDPRFFKNSLSTVFIGNESHRESFSFRNPVAFMSKDEETTRDAEHETDALIDYYFHHENVPPHVALNFIQRFVTSNPSPRYVEAVAVAFKTGVYGSFGNGTRGCLTATIAAVLLDREARSPLMHEDPSFGRLREPLIKLLHLMRGFDFNTSATRLVNMNLPSLGQAPYRAPSVFGWYEYDYVPLGAVEEASLVAPEASLLTPENIVTFLNGAMSMIRWGLTPCDDGMQIEWNQKSIWQLYSPNICNNLDTYRNGKMHRRASRYKGWLPWSSYIEDHSTGTMGFSPTDASASAEVIVKELDMVLTGGRCDPHVLGVIAAAYREKLAETTSAAEALKAAQQLLVVTAEFHTTAPNQLSNKVRKAASSATKSTAPRPYKAIVYLWMGGGHDSFNMLVPYDGCKGKDLYKEYSDIRGNLALEKEFLLPITAKKKTTKSGQVCRRFGLHFGMEAIQRLYNDGDVLFIANAGTLTEPITKEEYTKRQKRIPKPLFAHNTQTRYAQTMDGLNAERKNGVLGRILDVMYADGVSTASYMVSGGSSTFALNPVRSPPFDRITATAPVLSTNSDELLSSIDNITSAMSTSPLAELWADQLRRSLNRSVLLSGYLKRTTLSITEGWTDKVSKCQVHIQ